MESRPFVLLKDSRLAELRGLIAGVAGKWAEEWCGGTDTSVVDCTRAWETMRRSASWNRCHAGSGKAAWFSFTEDLPKELQRSMFGGEQRYVGQGSSRPSLAQEASLAAVDALIGDIAKAVGLPGKHARGLDEAPSPDEEFRRGSGAVAVEIAIGKFNLLCLLNDKCIGLPERSVPQPGDKPLVGIDLKKKLSGTPLSLQVALGSAEVDVGSLLMLQVGDVIRLDSAIDQPLALTGPEGQKMLNGYLGKQDGKMAIEVVASKQ